MLPNLFSKTAIMSEASANILEMFQQLTPDERVEVRRRINESVPMTDDFTDEEFASLAAESFRALDDEEAQRA